MKANKLLRMSGAALAAGLLLAQAAAFPASAAGTPTAKEISTCDYVYTIDGGLKVVQGTAEEFTLEQVGVPSTKALREIWMDVTMDVSSGKPAMPALGYDCPAYLDDKGEESTWYGDGLWMSTPTEHTTIIIPIPEDKPLTSSKFTVQLWGEAGDTIGEMTLNALGFMTGDGGQGMGAMTRKGDGNNDKTVDKQDVTDLAKYLTTESDTLASPANVNLDGNSRLDAADLTLLKRGILNGDFNKTIDGGETALEFAQHIKLGWNLGNSLDAQDPAYPKNSATEYETSWGNPIISKELIKAVKDAGFNTVRVPVSWGAKMDNTTYKIKDEWMNRVQEVVDYVIDNDMYCILNIHHDNSPANYPYFYPNTQNYERSEKFVTAVWSQVSERFAGYDEHLIFETLNEPRLVGDSHEWWFPSVDSTVQDAFNCINKLNAAALKSIRDSGGNNAKRYVLMPTYAASPNELNVNGMQMPDDDRIMAEIHGYRPENFAMNATSNWSESAGAGELIAFMNTLKNKFINNGIPVIIDEFGAVNNNNEDNRAEWAKYYVSLADSYGMACVWWDNNAFNVGKENFGLIERGGNTVKYPKIVAAMVEAAKNRG